MAVDAAFLIRLGSAFLFILLGIVVLAIGRRKRGPVALGAFLVTYAMVTVFTNVRLELAQSGYESPWLYLGSVPFVVAASISGFLAAAWLPHREAGWRTALGAGLLTGLLAALAMVDYSIAGDATNVGVPHRLIPFRFVMAGFYSVALAGMLSTASWRALQTRPATRMEWACSMAFNALLAPGIIVQWPGRFGQPWSFWTLASMLILLAGLTLPLLMLARRTAAESAARWALLWPAIGLLAYVYLLFSANVQAGLFDAYGLNGVLRIAGWAFLVYAILKADLLGVELPHFAVKRGTLAAGALATLFIVAQVAQNFFSAQYGLLTGGIVAGTFLFAASPVQKAIERAGERSRPSRASGPGVNEAAYRSAVEMALRDRLLTPKEELALADLAERLGIGARRATEIRLTAQAEREAR